VCCNTIRLARGRPALYSLCRRYGNVSAFRSDTPEDDPLRSTHLCARMTDAPEHSEKAPLAAESPDVGIPVCVTPYTPSGCGARTPRSVAGRHGDLEGGGGSNHYAVRGGGPLREFSLKISKLNGENPPRSEAGSPRSKPVGSRPTRAWTTSCRLNPPPYRRPGPRSDAQADRERPNVRARVTALAGRLRARRSSPQQEDRTSR